MAEKGSRSIYKNYAEALQNCAAAQPKVRVNDQGLLEGVNHDGSIAWVQDPNRSAHAEASRKSDSFRMSDKRMVLYTKDGEEVRLSYDPKLLKAKDKLWPYFEEIGLEIARRVVEGETIKQICSTEGMPPVYIVAKWGVEIPGFKAMLTEARKIRAEMFHDEIVEVKDKVDEDTSKSAKVKLDALKHLAAVGDPDTYGSKTKISGDVSAPLSFVFETGISRAPAALEENPAIPVEGGTIDDPNPEES